MAIENPAQTPKIWRAGTLTYGAGALFMLYFWLLWGDFTWSMKERAVLPAATLLIKQIGVSEFVYGLIIVAFPNFTNTFLSPIISYIFDRHRGRWGRRIPFLLFTTPFIVLGLYGLGASRMLGAALHEAVPVFSLTGATLLFFCIAWVMLDFGTTLSASLFNALANDVVPPEMLGRFFSLFRVVSLGAGMIFNSWLLEKVEAHTLPIFIGLGTLYGVGLLLMCWKVKEGEYPPAPEEPEIASTGGRRNLVIRVAHSVAVYFRQSFSLPYYRWFMAAWAIAGLSFAPVNFFSIQYAQQLGIGMDRYGFYLVVTYTFSLVLSYFLGMLADRFHPLRTGIWSLAAYAVLMFVSYPLMRNSAAFGVLFVLHGICSGCFFTFTASLSSRAVCMRSSGRRAGLSWRFSRCCSARRSGGLDWLNRDYRALFSIAGVVTLIGMGLFCKVYRDFLKLGGDWDYQPPMPK